MALSSTKPRTLVFWGSGATKALGIRTTLDQGKFVSNLVGVSSPSKSLDERAAEALEASNVDRWRIALVDLISILGDDDEAYWGIHRINNDQLNTMSRNWRTGASDEDLRRRIIGLRLTYDWPALKSVVRVCPGSKSGTIKLNDLFNLLDMHIPSGFGFHGPSRALDEAGDRNQQLEFFDVRRLIGAKNALLMLLIASFYIDYQVCVARKHDVLQKYKDFATLLGQRVLNKGLSLALAGEPLDGPGFYQDDLAFVSLNYDPILLWVQWIANRELNHSAAVPHVGSPPAPLHLFNDFGHLIPSRSIGTREPNFPWYPMNEAAVQRLNESSAGDPKVRLTKILFPHGCLCWRQCPDCGKVSAYHGDEWNLASVSLLPPPPLRAFAEGTHPDRMTETEKKEREEGRVDARACLHCGTSNYANHTQVVMQSSFKARPPSFIEEIQRDLQAMTMQAAHIIFMGYSLPPDDVTYRALFSARSQRRKPEQVRCTVVNKDEKHSDWYGPDELKTKRIENEPLRAATEIFGEDNVRFYGGGIPQVFLDGGLATEARLGTLLTWPR